MKRVLSALRITFTQWLVLQNMRELIAETEDAVSELTVAERSGIDRMTVSQVMWTLSRAGLVDIGPSAIWPAFRIWLTAEGERMAREGSVRVEALSAEWLDERATSCVS